MQKWVPIDIADALELLSPDFTNEEVSSLGPLLVCLLCPVEQQLCDSASNIQVRGHAVEVLGRADDDELRYYLLQLVQVYFLVLIAVGP